MLTSHFVLYPTHPIFIVVIATCKIFYNVNIGTSNSCSATTICICWSVNAQYFVVSEHMSYYESVFIAGNFRGVKFSSQALKTSFRGLIFVLGPEMHTGPRPIVYFRGLNFRFASLWNENNEIFPPRKLPAIILQTS